MKRKGSHDQDAAEAAEAPSDLNLIDFLFDRLAEIDAFVTAATRMFEGEPLSQRLQRERFARVFDHAARLADAAITDARRLLHQRHRERS